MSYHSQQVSPIKNLLPSKLSIMKWINNQSYSCYQLNHATHNSWDWGPTPEFPIKKPPAPDFSSFPRIYILLMLTQRFQKQLTSQGSNAAVRCRRGSMFISLLAQLTPRGKEPWKIRNLSQSQMCYLTEKGRKKTEQKWLWFLGWAQSAFAYIWLKPKQSLEASRAKLPLQQRRGRTPKFNQVFLSVESLWGSGANLRARKTQF